MKGKNKLEVARQPCKYSKSVLKITTIIVFITLIMLCVPALAQDNATNYWNEKSDYWFKRGFQLSGSHSYEDALKAYDKALRMNPENADAWSGKALALRYLSLNEHDLDKYSESLKASDKAIELYDKAIKADPQDVNARYYKGLAISDKAVTMQAAKTLNIDSNKQERIKCFEEAISAYDTAIEINPKYITAWKNKGNILYSLGKYNDSIQACDKAIEIAPEYGLAWYSKGLALNRLGRYEEAAIAYDKAIETFPENADIWYNKGIALYSMGNYDDALECYDRALELKPSFAKAWHGKGDAFEKIGFQIGADAAFAKAEDLGYSGEA